MPVRLNGIFKVIAIFTNSLIVELDSGIGGVHDAADTDFLIFHTNYFYLEVSL